MRSFVGNQDQFKSRSNFNMFNQDEKRWCAKHITGFWGKKDDGTWFEQCHKGFTLKEKCEIGEND